MGLDGKDDHESEKQHGNDDFPTLEQGWQKRVRSRFRDRDEWDNVNTKVGGWIVIDDNDECLTIGTIAVSWVG